jgi:hypothetical protein
MSTGGSIESVTLTGRTYSVAADADVSRKIGGFENDIQVNGNGSTREIKTRVAWSLTGITLSIDDDLGDQEFLQDLMDANANFAITITYASGAIWQATGQVSGEVTHSSQATTASIELGGPGKLTQQ